MVEERDEAEADAERGANGEQLERRRAAARAAFAECLERRRAGDFDEDAWLAGLDASTRGELLAILDDYTRLRREFGEHAFTLVPGARIGPFELVREVGRGGMGVVWEANQRFPRRRVALKLLYPHLCLLPSAIERFEREASVAAGLASEHIVRIWQVGAHQDLRWIAMELVEGGLTLADHIADLRRRAPPPDHARRMAAIARDMARALQHAHDNGVLHRDVKPGNILLAPGFRPKLGDFGLAREEGGLALTRFGDQVGTPMYASPEQVRGALALDARSDLYSLGATLLEALTLERPHAAGDERELARGILADDLPDPRAIRPSLPRDLSLVVKKLGALRPEARYASAREAADDLQRFLDGVAVLARAPTILERGSRWVRRRPAASSIVGIVLASSAILLGLARGADAEALRARHATALLRSLVDLQDPLAAEAAPAGPEELAHALLAAAEELRRADAGRAARLSLAAGRSWRIAGRLRDAAESMRLAMRLADSDPGLRLEAGETLARALAELDDHDGLRPLLRELLELSKRIDVPTPGTGPHPRTWRLLCESYSLRLRCEDRAGAAELERLHSELVPPGGLLEGMRARRARLARSGEPESFEAGLQLLRALCHKDLAAEGGRLADELLHESRGAPLRAASEARLLRLVCEGRQRAVPALEHLANAERLALELEELHGADHPLALGARFRAAVASLDAWGSSPAGAGPSLVDVLRGYEALVARMERHLGPVHVDTLKARTGQLLARLNLAVRQPSPPSLDLLEESERLCAAFRARCGPLHSRTVVAERTRLGVLSLFGEDAQVLEARRALVAAYDAAGGQPNMEAFDLRIELAGHLIEAGCAEEARARAAATLAMLGDAPFDDVVRRRLRRAATLDLACALILLGRRHEVEVQVASLAAQESRSQEAADFGHGGSHGAQARLRRQIALGRALLQGDGEVAAREAACLALAPGASGPELVVAPTPFEILCLRLHPMRGGARLAAELEALERRLEAVGGPEWRMWQAMQRACDGAAPMR